MTAVNDADKYVEKFAVIVAGGSGTRMGTAVPKQFLQLAGRPVLYYTLHTFVKAVPEVRLVLVLPAHQLSYAQMVLQAFGESRLDVELVAGGETRFHSVQNGLRGVPPDALVAVHDGVRCLITESLVRRCFAQAAEKGSAVPAVPVADSIRELVDANGEDSLPVDRARLRAVQTPQTFQASILLPAYKQAWREDFTDEATVVEANGGRIHLIQGERANLKITTPDDLILAEAILAARAASP
jgi:2-C-methyl-D-erythritol 4-phosphate cytidylyltransferase